jgi:uncharacterized protein YqiB (DUF1249 family)
MISTRPDRLFKELGRQRRLASLMSLYERNYLLLKRIIPDLRKLAGALESHSERDETLHLEVVEHTRYTSVLRLTYMIPIAGNPSAVPNLKVRLYHDAQVAEVLDFGGMAASGPGPDSLLRRWTENLLLEKWLNFVDENGHEFL